MFQIPSFEDHSQYLSHYLNWHSLLIGLSSLYCNLHFGKPAFQYPSSHVLPTRNPIARGQHPTSELDIPMIHSYSTQPPRPPLLISSSSVSQEKAKRLLLLFLPLSFLFVLSFTPQSLYTNKCERFFITLFLTVTSVF